MAQRHPTSSRTPKGANSESEDAFVAGVYEATTWAQRNTQTLILMGVVVAVLVAGGAYYYNFRSNLTEQAVLQLEQIQQATAVGDREAAKGQLATYIARFEGTRYADEARLVLAGLHLTSGSAPLAVEVLQASEVGLNDPLGVQIVILEGKALEEAGRLDEAEDIYLRVADQAELDFQVTGALADAARVRTSKDDLAGAVELYQRLVDSLEETDPERAYYQMRLAEIRVRIAG